MKKVKFINWLIKLLKVDTNKISDGYHTIGELYEHRLVNYVALCKTLNKTRQIYPTLQKLGVKRRDILIWRSTRHSDNTYLSGWFIMGIGTKGGKQITYHLPMSFWGVTDFAETLSKAPWWDNHDSTDVLERLKNL